ncbi:MAG: pantothenate synthase [Phylliscum demangeonii]|nr:MAG: pantothenate synthase [Phylliscum demangeonii]
MGALHAGHMSLIRQAAQENAHVIVSIFVNPTQFAAHEDLDTYPRTWDADMKILNELNPELATTDADAGCAGCIRAVFAPTSQTMYPASPPSSDPNGSGSFVTITPLSSILEGQSRPTFFRGVTTVCMKLFNIVDPDKVYFGQKDVQQTVVVKRMVADFFLPTEVRIVPTLREADGLALSSRNVYLGERRRRVSKVLYASLKQGEDVHASGAKSRAAILAAVEDAIRSVGRQQDGLDPALRTRFELEYLSLADPDTLEEVEEADSTRGAVLSGAIKMLPLEAPQRGEDTGLGGGRSAVRLIDNLVLKPQKELDKSATAGDGLRS